MDDNLHNKNNSVSAIIFAGAVFLIIALVLGVLFLMGGNTTTIIGDSGFDAVQSITCENDNVIYPFFQDDAYKRYLKINMIRLCQPIDRDFCGIRKLFMIQLNRTILIFLYLNPRV